MIPKRFKNKPWQITGEKQIDGLLPVVKADQSVEVRLSSNEPNKVSVWKTYSTTTYAVSKQAAMKFFKQLQAAKFTDGSPLYRKLKIVQRTKKNGF